MKTKIVSILVILAILTSFGSYFFVKRDFERVKEISEIEDSYDANLEYEVEEIKYLENDILIKGWLAEINSENRYINRSILLKDTEGNIISIKTEVEERKDLSLRNTEETKYDKCGLVGRVKNDKLKKYEKYQIGFMVISEDEKEKVIFTDNTIEVR